MKSEAKSRRQSSPLKTITEKCREDTKSTSFLVFLVAKESILYTSDWLFYEDWIVSVATYLPPQVTKVYIHQWG